MDRADRAYARAQGASRRVTITLPDDSGAMQRHQIEGYTGEIRNDIQFLGLVGVGSVPLAGAKGVVLFHGGNPGFGAIVGIEDPRYRPKGHKPGESFLYAVDGAGGDGTGGTAWEAFQALAGQVAKMLGKVLVIGDANALSITATGQTINITGQTGDVVVNGISLVNHTHPTPAGQSGAPE